MTAMHDALSSLAQRLDGERPPREREVLCVLARLKRDEDLEKARREILKWVAKRAGALPESAWAGEAFEFTKAGRNCLVTTWEDDAARLWALRADDPDKNVARRVWGTEIVLGGRLDEAPWFSLRLLVNSTEQEIRATPAVPGLVRQIVRKTGLQQRGRAVAAVSDVGTREGAEDLCDLLADPERRRPVIILSRDAEKGFPEPSLDTNALGKATIGLAHLFVLPAEHAWALTERFGARLSVFHGGVRIYMPDFDEGADPFQHRLFLGDRLRDAPAREACITFLRRAAAAESLRRRALGRDVVSFAQVRQAALAAVSKRLEKSGDRSEKRLAAVLEENEQLKKNFEEVKSLYYMSDSEKDAAVKTAADAEARLRFARARVEQLENALAARGLESALTESLPESWGDAFLDWIDRNFATRIALLPAARRGVRTPKLKDMQLAARCIKWLAGPARDSLMGKNDLELRDCPIESGFKNAPCGKDSYQALNGNKRMDIKQHIKNGSNTRNPDHCLRIYWAWDEHNQEIVISDMPAHRRTGAT